MSSEVVGSMSEWSGVLKDLFRQVDDGSLKLSQLKAFVEHRNPFEIDMAVLLEDWQKFYKDLFGLSLDFSQLLIPSHKKGFDRLIVVAQGMTAQCLYDKCAELFPCWKWTENNLDKIIRSDRTAERSHYAVWFRDRQEADKELKGLSAYQLEEREISGITLEERQLYGFKFFRETGGHLDQTTITLCSGSRCRGGSVPSVYWSSGDRRVCVSWCDPGYAYGFLRSRSAVSLPAKQA